MNQEILKQTVSKMMASGKGVLAADESNETADARLEAVGVEAGEENRRRYRDLFLSTLGIEKYLSGVILYDETIRQTALDGEPFVKKLVRLGIVPGIKVDRGAKDLPNFPGEKITEGLDGLSERLTEYFEMGALFAKWRAVITIGENIPTDADIDANADTLARYAGLCQAAGIVPMVEPEVLLEGTHSMAQAEEVTTKIVACMCAKLSEYRVWLPGTILKTSMVVPGNKSGEVRIAEEIAEATVRYLKTAVPENMGGVVFLSGGQTPEEATLNLDAIAKHEPLPWEVTFSYARALQGPVLEVWRGKDENIKSAREVFIKRLKESVLADQGKFKI